MNKNRLQHALSIGGTVQAPKMPINVKYTRMWFKESAQTLTSGRATTISASCNAFYLWYLYFYPCWSKNARLCISIVQIGIGQSLWERGEPDPPLYQLNCFTARIEVLRQSVDQRLARKWFRMTN